MIDSSIENLISEAKQTVSDSNRNAAYIIINYFVPDQNLNGICPDITVNVYAKYLV